MSCTGDCRRATGKRHAHCGSCHQTFAGVTLFDDHRKGGMCADPLMIGMRKRNGVWHGEPDPRFASAVRPQAA